MINFISNILLSYSEFNEFINITDLVINNLVDQMSEKGTKIDFNEIISKIGQLTLDKFKGEN
ncbi:UNVERIFIED_CONTAM: hypothetical protein O8I53_08050 [Campylobacter lari]